MIFEMRIDKAKTNFKVWSYKDKFGRHVLIHMFNYVITMRRLP